MNPTPQTIAEDLWRQFRLLAMIIDRGERFVPLTPTGQPSAGDAAGPSSWLKSLAGNEAEIRAIADDLVLRAFRVALDPINFVILAKLVEQPSVPFSELTEVAGLNRLSVTERVNDLIQAGLASKDIETGQVQASNAAAALVDFVHQIQEQLGRLIRERLPQLAP